MVVTDLAILLAGLGLAFSATVNASPSMLTGDTEAQQMGNCIAWYSPQLRSPPETCNDVVNMHPGLDLATFLKLNPAIHPYCDNMLVGQRVCIGSLQQNDCPKPAEPSPQSQEASSKQWQTSSSQMPQEASSTPSLGWH